MTNKSSADIRLAEKRDLKKIMLFIKNEWSHDHILANNQLFFEYQYCSDNNVNFVIALEGKRIMGVLGFIKSSDNEANDDGRFIFYDFVKGLILLVPQAILGFMIRLAKL